MPNCDSWATRDQAENRPTQSERPLFVNLGFAPALESSVQSRDSFASDSLVGSSVDPQHSLRERPEARRPQRYARSCVKVHAEARAKCYLQYGAHGDPLVRLTSTTLLLPDLCTGVVRIHTRTAPALPRAR